MFSRLVVAAVVLLSASLFAQTPCRGPRWILVDVQNAAYVGADGHQPLVTEMNELMKGRRLLEACRISEVTESVGADRVKRTTISVPEGEGFFMYVVSAPIEAVCAVLDCANVAADR